ncbi:hypothetical protein GCM10020001_070210 [Nonomuraea salmonea]
MATPQAPYASAATSPPPVEEPAGRDDRDVHRVHHLGQQQRGREGPGVPAALAALHDDRVRPPPRHLLGVPPRPPPTG